MELIIILVVLYAIFGSTMNKKAKQAKNAEQAKQQASAPKQNATFDVFPSVESSPKRSAPAVQKRTASAPSVHSGQPGMAYQPIKHRMEDIHSHNEYRGSLGAISGEGMGLSSEGKDMCDPSLGHERERVVLPGSVYESEIGHSSLLDMSAEGLLRGMVMSEILARPANRKWGRR